MDRGFRFGRTARGLVAYGGIVLLGCSPPQIRPGSPMPRDGDEIVVAGQFFHTTAPVVLWFDPEGYDGYRYHRRFEPNVVLPADADKNGASNRFDSFRRHLSPEMAEDVRTQGWSIDQLREVVDLFVIHYDACGTSRRCFEVLHDQRGLSVHFLLDLDGTLYQTLDLKERARHAGTANDRSIGIEIANLGAYENTEKLDTTYIADDSGKTRIVLPPDEVEWIRTPGFVARPSRDRLIQGNVQGRALVQYDFTDAQYDSLIRLAATVNRILPKITLDYPRDTHGQLISTILDEPALSQFHGILGHFHVSKDKVDPGPAFDWDRVVSGARVP